MPRTIDFRQAVKSDIPQLVDLMNSEYMRKKGDAYFLWQYFDSYYPTVLFCAFKSKQLVGMFGFQKRRLRDGATVGQAIDMLVAPDYRGQGIFKTLAGLATQSFHDIDLLCVFPNLNGKNAVENALGWRTIGSITTMRVQPRAVRGASEENSELQKTGQKRSLSKFLYDAGIRKWRFDAHPDYTYSYFHIDDATSAVTKVFTDPGDGKRFGDIVEFECDLDSTLSLEKLFLQTSRHLEGNGVEEIAVWISPHTPLYDVALRLGFRQAAQERFFCVQVINEHYHYLTDFSCWHLVQADSEIF